MAKRNMEYQGFEEEPQVVYKKKGGFLGKFVSLLLGIVIGIGSVAGAGYFVVKKKTAKELFGYAKLDHSLYLTEEYATQTLWDLVGSVASKLSNFSTVGTLQTLADISPYVEMQVMNFVEKTHTEFGVDFNYDGMLMQTPMSNISDYIKACVTNAPAGDMFSNFGQLNGIMVNLCYGIEGEDYTVDAFGNIVMKEGKSQTLVGEFMGSGLSSRIAALPLDLIMNVNYNDKITCTLAYGASHRYTIEVDPFGVQSVKMNQQFYYIIQEGDTITVLDDAQQPVVCTATKTDEGYSLLFEDGKLQYATQTDEYGNAAEGNLYYAYNTEGTPETTKPAYFKKTTVGELQENSTVIINNITLADALQIKHDSHPVLISLAYGEEGVDYTFIYDAATGDKKGINPLNPPRTIGDLRKEGASLFDNIYLTDVIAPSPTEPLIMYLLYGKEGVHYSYNQTENTYTMLQKQVAIASGSTKVYNEYGEEIAYAVAGGNATYTQKDENGALVSTYDLTDSGQTMTIFDGTQQKQAKIYYVSKDGTPIHYVRTRFVDLSDEDNALLNNMTSRLTLGDVIEIQESDTILKHLKDTAIEDIPAAAQNLSVMQVFEDEIHYLTFDRSDVVNAAGTYSFQSRHGGVFSVTYNAGLDAYSYFDGTQTVNEGDYIDMLGFKVDGEHRVMCGAWKYLLTDWEGNKTPDEFKLSDMNALISNVTHNMKVATLNDMYIDEILLLEDDSLLSTQAMYTFLGIYNVDTVYYKDADGNYTDKDGNIVNEANRVAKTYYGEFTVSEMVSYITQVSQTIPTGLPTP